MSPVQGSVDGPGRRGRAADGAVLGVTLGGKARDAGSGDVWLATVDATGASATVRRLRLPPDPVVREEALHAARRLLDARHPHLVEVQDVVATGDGIALVSDPVPGSVSLTRLLDVRQRLEPGEVVTIGLPIAQALAAAHAVGLTHGDISGDDILIEPTGRPVLAGVGAAPLVGVRSSTPDDVGDLSALLLGAMPQAVGPDAAAVAVAVAPALVDDLARRPSADDLAESLARACVPRPVVGLNRAAPPPESPLAPVRSLADVRAEATGRPVRPAPDVDSGFRGADSGGADPAGADSGGAGSVAGAAGSAGGWTSLDPDEGPARPPGPEQRSAPGGSRTAPPARQGAGAGRRSSRRRGPAGGRSGSTGSPGSPGPAGSAGAAGSAGLRPRGAPPARRGSRRPSTSTRTVGERSARARATAAGWLSRPGAVPVLIGVALVAVLAVLGLVVAGGGGSGKGASPAAGGAAASAGTATAGAARPAAGVSASAGAPQSAAQVQWRATLGALNTARSRAFEIGQQKALTNADAPGSPAFNADASLMRAMVARGAHVSPLRTDIVALSVRSTSASRTVLRITDRLGPYYFLDGRGKALARQPGKGAQGRDVTLVKVGGGWRISTTTLVG